MGYHASLIAQHQGSLMKYPFLLLTCSLLAACGGGGSEPLSKDNTAPPVNDSAECGSSFLAQRHFNQQETNIAYWQIEGDAIQTKPQVTFYPNKSSSLAETNYKGTEALCEQVANIFGADVREAWQGAENSAIKPGQQFKYTPQLSISFSLPKLASLADWRAKGSPSTMPTELTKSSLTVWYENSDEQKFLQGDLSTNQKSISLTCDDNEAALQVALSEVDDQLSSNLNPAFCEVTRIGNESKTVCLEVKLEQERPLESCQFALTDIFIPDSQGNKTTVKLAAKIKATNDLGVMVEVDSINID
jgi:hypothetical protein